MSADRLLTTVLRAYQGVPNPDESNRIFSSTTSLLTTLSNPLNITLLTTHLLSSPAIWHQVDGLHIALRVLSIFNTAAITVRKHEVEGTSKPYDAYQPRLGGGLKADEWTKSVIQALDERSPRWQHMLVIAGVLLGMEGNERQGLSRGLRTTLENAMVTAANMALESPASSGVLGAHSIVLALNHAFPLLSNRYRRDLNYDGLLMILVKAMTSMDGYQGGDFLDPIDFDVRQVPGNRFDWPSNSPSSLRLQKVASQPLISSMGPLSRLIAHAIQHTNMSMRILEVQDHLLEFTGNLLRKWQKNKLCEIDPSEEEIFLTQETLRVTHPLLWQVLKTSMFATVVVLRAVIGRTLIDSVLSSPNLAPSIASKNLSILKNVHFVSSRLGSNVFSAYTFVNLTSIDILTRCPSASVTFLESIYPIQAGQIPENPAQRNHDLFYLNTVEHFALSLSPADNEILLVKPSTPYLSPTANISLIEIFEAAHSAMLAVLAAPQNADLTTRIIPFYVERLFSSFPGHLSPRQFRFAFKALLQITTPPNPLASSQPMMAETLLDILHHRALNASTTPLSQALAIKSEEDALAQDIPLSEQAVLLLSLLDALPHVTLDILQGWLPMAADLLNVIKDQGMKEYCKRRFWAMLEGGEMDVERSAVCVSWWGVRGGREKVLFGDAEDGPFMSGGLGLRDGSRL